MTPRPRPRDAAARGERGTVTIWSIWLCIMIGLLGLVITDAWRAISAWRRTASAADAAAIAGASGIDTTTFDASGGRLLQLAPDTAETLAHQSLATQGDTADIDTWTAEATTEEIVVTVHATVDLPLLGLISDEPISMTATAAADPRPSS